MRVINLGKKFQGPIPHGWLIISAWIYQAKIREILAGEMREFQVQIPRGKRADLLEVNAGDLS